MKKPRTMARQDERHGRVDRGNKRHVPVLRSESQRLAQKLGPRCPAERENRPASWRVVPFSKLHLISSNRRGNVRQRWVDQRSAVGDWSAKAAMNEVGHV